MFFHISHNEEKTTIPFSQTRKIGKFTVSTDAGWHSKGHVLYKGYCVDQSLEQKVTDRNFIEQSGNYVILDFSDGGASIRYDNSRSFPMYYDGHRVTNYQDTSLTAVWFDGAVKYRDNKWEFEFRKENKIKYPSGMKNLNKEQLVDRYCEYLVSCCNIKTPLPFFCANSNGVDSLVIKSAFDYCGIDYQLVDNNSKRLKYLGWGYKQIFVTDTPHIQLTGFCGDELMLRNPLYVQWLLDPYNINLIDEFDKVEHSYMKGFFNKKYKEKILINFGKIKTIPEAYEHMTNVAVNDYQIWHIDQTLTFTPFRNIKMALECLRADPDTMLDQVIHAGLSKDIIRRLNKRNLDLISTHKNDVTAD
jgi:hypothetical protein